MRSFTDSQGRQWDVVLNLTTLMRVKARTGVNLAEAALDPGQLAEACSDPVKMFGCLCALLDDQLTQRGISDEEFGTALDSQDVSESAVMAVWGACSDFSPPAVKTLLGKVTAKTAAELNRRKQLAMQEVANVTDETISSIVQAALNDSAGNSPESSESIPATTH